MKKIKTMLAGALIILSMGTVPKVSQIRADQELLVTFPDRLDWLVEKISQCESGDNPNEIDWNDGGSPSYGLLQWKEASAWYYNQKYQVLPNLERSELMNEIMDPWFQTELAKKVLQEPGGYQNWLICSRKIGY